jgi:hypothetical protein
VAVQVGRARQVDAHRPLLSTVIKAELTRSL